MVECYRMLIFRVSRRAVYELHPFEVIFVKTYWVEISAEETGQEPQKVLFSTAEKHNSIDLSVKIHDWARSPSCEYWTLAFQEEENIPAPPLVVEDLYTTFVSSVSANLQTKAQTADFNQSCGFKLGPSIMVIYSYHESPRAARNLRFFLDQTVQDWAAPGKCQTGPRLELVLVIRGPWCTVALPSASNALVLRVDDSGTDFGAYTDALEALGITVEAQGWKLLYKYFIFINSSCRGPFLVPYASMLHWTDPFTSKITAEVKLVGPSIHFIPGVVAKFFYNPLSPT